LAGAHASQTRNWPTGWGNGRAGSPTRRDLTLVGRRDDNEDIGNGKMLRDIEGNDIEALLVKGSVCHYAGKLDGIFSGAQ